MGEVVELYPDIAVDLVLDDRELDLSMREADVAIRMAPPRQPELIQRHLLTVHMQIFAAPSYIKRQGKIGRAHVWTPVTNAQLVCRILLEEKNWRAQAAGDIQQQDDTGSKSEKATIIK